MRQVNVEGLIHATVIGGMRARRYGRIVNISSIAAIGTALPGNAFYAATKSEVAILTKRFATELGTHKITVNAVAPGFVRTDMTQRGRGAGDWQGTEESFAAKAMMGRIGEPEDIANAVAFLASPPLETHGAERASPWPGTARPPHRNLRRDLSRAAAGLSRRDQSLSSPAP
jgi:NAD(P)-dependent dehydrogenase (short-subunit alcohol dehydrogenase family)